MKELIGRVTLTSLNIPRKITFNKIDLFDETKVAHEFNFFFTNTGKSVASKIPNVSTPLRILLQIYQILL